MPDQDCAAVSDCIASSRWEKHTAQSHAHTASLCGPGGTTVGGRYDRAACADCPALHQVDFDKDVKETGRRDAACLRAPVRAAISSMQDGSGVSGNPAVAGIHHLNGLKKLSGASGLKSETWRAAGIGDPPIGRRDSACPAVISIRERHTYVKTARDGAVKYLFTQHGWRGSSEACEVPLGLAGYNSCGWRPRHSSGHRKNRVDKFSSIR